MKIVISGTSGVGKTTTSKILIKTLEDKGYKVNFLKEEIVDSPYLGLFFEKPEEWGFLAQLDFLLNRFKQWIKDEADRKKTDDSNTITIYDRHVLDDLLFAELKSVKRNINNLDSVMFNRIYTSLLEKMNEWDSYPDAFILLQADFEIVKSRINKRGREEEKKSAIAYWKELYDSYYNTEKYQEHFKNHSKRVININTNTTEPEDVVNIIIDKLGL